MIRGHGRSTNTAFRGGRPFAGSVYPAINCNDVVVATASFETKFWWTSKAWYSIFNCLHCWRGGVNCWWRGAIVNLFLNLSTLLCNDLLFASSSEKWAKIMALFTEQGKVDSFERKRDWAVNLVRGHTWTANPFGADLRETVSVVVQAAPGAVLVDGGFGGWFLWDNLLVLNNL